MAVEYSSDLLLYVPRTGVDGTYLQESLWQRVKSQYQRELWEAGWTRYGFYSFLLAMVFLVLDQRRNHTWKTREAHQKWVCLG